MNVHIFLVENSISAKFMDHWIFIYNRVTLPLGTPPWISMNAVEDRINYNWLACMISAECRQCQP